MGTYMMWLPEGLPPVFGTFPRVMILGSFPGPRSLKAGEYYGNPNNQFWKIIECLFGIPESLSYAERIREIGCAGIALWDVIRSCERDGATDNQIRNVTVNDIPAMLDRYPSIQVIGINGKTAGRYFSRAWPAGFKGVDVTVLPSTSPANARMRLEGKVLAWHRIMGGDIPSYLHLRVQMITNDRTDSP
jgi:double-stranded uracil-DNA glycosylase